MQIIVNGQCKEVPEGISVASLLDEMSLEPHRVAVELNKQLVPRTRHTGTALAEKDKLEIVTLVGGG